MAGTRGEVSGSDGVAKAVPDRTSGGGSEINVADYLRVIWRRRRFLVIATVLPTVLVWLVVSLGPRYYKVTYTYQTRLDEKGYRLLLDKFYSAENLDDLISRLKACGLSAYARKIASASTEAGLKWLVSFTVSPSYFDVLSSSTRVTAGEADKIQQIKGTLLMMTITGRPAGDMEQLCSVIREGVESVVPVYSLKHELNSSVVAMKSAMVDIEESRFALELELESKRAALEKLKAVKSAGSPTDGSGIVLQFNDLEQTSEYLPLSHQIQAYEAKIIKLEERMKTDEKSYAYYKELLAINERLFNEIRGKMSSHYTIQEFHSFLTGVIKDYEARELTDYLSAYIKRVENLISTNIPVIEKPRVYPVAKEGLKKTVIVFVGLLVVGVGGVFVMEGVRERTSRAA
ncbi:MAG: hypothetical protein JSU94_17755 [Phycisphaerales bacterium]|nr:MAG: hypothetical protein JSU94_17755 [Phycisphaerales bacterium]